MGLLKQVAPIAASLYGARLLSGKIGDKIPGLDAIPEQFRGAALAGLLAVGGHFATTKVGALRKWREGIMIGLGINLVDKVLKAISPDAAAMFGVSEYIAVGAAPPIDDNLTLSEYVAVGEYEQDLGAEQDLGFEQEMGLEQDLGDFTDRNLGGLSRSAMVAPVQSMKFLAPVPARSFTSAVPGVGPGFDEHGKLYTGIFAGGWGYNGSAG